MINLEPINIEGHTFLTISVELPKSNLLVVSNDKGYIICGALEVALLNEKLKRPESARGKSSRRENN